MTTRGCRPFGVAAPRKAIGQTRVPVTSENRRRHIGFRVNHGAQLPGDGRRTGSVNLGDDAAPLRRIGVRGARRRRCAARSIKRQVRRNFVDIPGYAEIRPLWVLAIG